MSSFSGASDTEAALSPSSLTSSARLPAGDIEAQEHPLYYFYDGSFSFQLEGVKYRVHESLILRHCEDGSCWREYLGSPSGFSRSAVDAFFSLIYMAAYESLEFTLSVESWVSVLELATIWFFPGIRKLAIKKLSAQASPVEKLFLCHEYDVYEWFIPACAALVLRPAPLTMNEGGKLEKHEIVRIFRAREALHGGVVAATESAVSAFLTAISPDVQNKLKKLSVAPEMSPSETGIPETAVASEIPAAESSQCSQPVTSTKALPPSTNISGTSSSAPPPSPTPPPPPSSLPTAAVVPEPSESGPSSQQTDQDVLKNVMTAIRVKRYDDALALISQSNVGVIGKKIPIGSFVTKDWQDLTRATMRRAFKTPTFISVAAALLSVLSTRTSQRLEVILHDDMQYLASRWTTFKNNGVPAPDNGRLMFDIEQGRTVYSTQISHAKMFFRALARLRVVPADNKWLVVLVA